MGNYKPKTAYQFRWEDSKKIQKFIQGQVILNDIVFTLDENYNIKNVPEAKKLVDTMKYCFENQIPLIVYDYNNDSVWISSYFKSKDSINLQNVDGNEFAKVSLVYNGVDTLAVTYVMEEVLTTDNVKTLFGQDITGTGDINLYRHELIISTGRTSYDETEYKVYLTYYSSNKLEANTPEKLTTLTKANSTTILRGIVLEFANAGVQNAPVSGKYSGVNYLGPNGWALEKTIGGSDGTAITSVSDIVTPI